VTDDVRLDSGPDERDQRVVTAGWVKKWGTRLHCPACDERCGLAFGPIEHDSPGGRAVAVLTRRLGTDDAWHGGKSLAGVRVSLVGSLGRTGDWPLNWLCQECSTGVALTFDAARRVSPQTRRILLIASRPTT
jgi:hypothetical protein